MRLQGFMGIKVKQTQRSFNRCLHYHELLVRMQIPSVLCHARCLLRLPRKLLGHIVRFSNVR